MIWMLYFINTIWYATHMEKKDPIMDLDWVKRFVVKMTGRELSSDPQSLSLSLMAFRAELMDIVAEFVYGDFDEEACITLLNSYISKSQGHMLIEKSETFGPVIKFTAEVADEAFVLARLAIECHHFIFETDRSIVRICENPTCACYFLDESKNKSKRHCAPNCNNVMKARRHREKIKSRESID